MPAAEALRLMIPAGRHIELRHEGVARAEGILLKSCATGKLHEKVAAHLRNHAGAHAWPDSVSS